MALLEALHIPRVRCMGLSVFNFVGTFVIAWLVVVAAQLGTWITALWLFAAFVPVAVVVHAWIGEPTPLVRLARTHWQCRLILWITFAMCCARGIQVYLRG